MCRVALPPVMVHQTVRAQDVGQVNPWWRKEFGLDGDRADGARVGIVDTGVDEKHTQQPAGDLRGVYVAHRDFSNSGNAWDKFGHGTHVGGIVAALDNDAGVLGAGPGARLWNAKALGDDGGGTDSGVAQAIRWCVDEGCQIINCSLGSAVMSPAIAGAVDYAVSHGVLVVAASGNEGSKSQAVEAISDAAGAAGIDEVLAGRRAIEAMAVSYPADHPGTIAVGAISRDRTIAPFSNQGLKVQCVGPGVQILSTYRGGGYAELSGTSMATPWVTAVFALAIKANGGKNISHAMAVDLLKTCCDDLGTAGRDKAYGYGLPIVSKILAAVAPPPPPSPPPAVPSLPSFVPIAHNSLARVVNINGEVGIFLPALK